MKEEDSRKSILEDRRAAGVLMIICAVVWASAYTFNKLGMAEFGIGPGMTSAKIVFAGIRFFAAGLLTLVIAAAAGRKIAGRGASFMGPVLLLSLVYIAVRYGFFYIGLSNLTGSRSSILDSTGTFLTILFACAVFPDDRMTARKIFGCVLGFSGILLVNLEDGLTGGFSLTGDGMILIASVLWAVGALLSRVLSRRWDPLVVTGYSLAMGGGLMIVAGLAFRGTFPAVTGKGILCMLCLILISSVAFSIYSSLLTRHPVSEISIYNALIPILGVLLSCFFLREPFLARYILAGCIVAAGIYLVNR